MLEQSGCPTTVQRAIEQTYRHQDIICQGISREWKDNHQICKIMIQIPPEMVEN